MRKFLVDHKFVTTLATWLALGCAPLAHGNILKDVATQCGNLLWSGRAFRGADAELAGNWIILKNRRPQLAQVLASEPTALKIRWMNLATMMTEDQMIPRPQRILLADDVAYARYERDLTEGRAAADADAHALANRIVRVDLGLGTARILKATPRELEIEYIESATFQRRSTTIARPSRIEFVNGFAYDEIARRADILARHPELREGHYVFWAPGIPVGPENLLPNGSLLLQYDQPFEIAYGWTLIEALRTRGKIHAFVGSVDLVGGIVTLASRDWAIKVPLREDIFARSRVTLSPVGVLDEIPHEGFKSFREFREAFLFGKLRPGMALIQYREVGPDPFRAPEEFSHTWTFWRLEAFDADSVTVQMNSERRVLRGAEALAGLSVGFDFERNSAEYLVSRYETERLFKQAFNARSTAPRKSFTDADALLKMPFLKDFALIERELTDHGMQTAQIEFYAQELLAPRPNAAFFWTGQRSAKEEYRRIQRELHESKLIGLSDPTRQFVSELYKLANAAARDLRGYSVGR